MNTKRAFISFWLVFALLVVLAPVALAHTESDPQVQKLIAGNPKNGLIEVGEVLVWNDATNLHVKFVIVDKTPSISTDNWWISATHVAVNTNFNLIPQTSNGNPIPGQFQYSSTWDPAQPVVDVVIPITWPVGTQLYIAAHGVVERFGGLVGLEYALPDYADFKVTFPQPGGPAYFPTLTIANGGVLNNVYPGWCIDTNHYINENQWYNASVYSSYEPLPAGTVDHPENFDLVNWILNQNYLSQWSPCAGRNYTYGDVQAAMWALLENTPANQGLNVWSACSRDEIVAAAMANGEGFVPTCNQVVAIVLIPAITGTQPQIVIAQTVMTTIGVPCEGQSNTAWGAFVNGTSVNYPFPGKQWGLWFYYTIQ